MSIEIMKLRDEQKQAATLLLAGSPERRGLELCIADCLAEEILILEGK